MARLTRLIVAGQPHLLIQRTLDQRPAFVDEEDRARLLLVLRNGIAAEGMKLHAWALLGHELRLVVTPPNPQSPARLIQTLGRRYVSLYNRRHARSGTLWNGRFMACVLEPGEPLLTAMAWVEQAGGGGANQSSSAAHHLGQRQDILVNDPPAFWTLGNTPFEREMAWRERLDQGVPEKIVARLHQAVRGGWPFGSDTFARAVTITGRPIAPRPAGRPRRHAPSAP